MNREARFQQRVMPHLDAAYNLARWLTRNDHDAEDVVQDAFLRAYRFLDSLRDADARPWLLTIVRNTACSWLRKNRPGEMVAIEDVSLLPGDAESVGHASPVETNPEVILLQAANRKLVNRALEELPVAFREVLVMRELEDMSYKEIASVAGIPLGTVMSRLSRGRELLRQALDDRAHQQASRP